MKKNNKELDIFGTKYGLEYVDNIDIKKEFPNANPNDTCDGFADYDDKRIVIALKTLKGEKVNDDNIELTLLHELFHVFLVEGQYSNINTEPLVQWLARCTLNILKQKII